MESPTDPAVPAVMLLSLWRRAGQPWHARIVDSDARVSDFDSPFELARYLCMPPAQTAPSESGLR